MASDRTRIWLRILNQAEAVDARVSGFESLFVKLTLAECQSRQHPQRKQQKPFPQNQPHSGSRPAEFRETCWDFLDSVQLREVFQHRVPVLQSCPHHIRGLLRQAARQALEARSRARRTQDRGGEIRGWKLFCLLPMLLFHRPSGDRKVSKPELCRRLDLFAEGNSEVLWRYVVRVAGAPVHTHTRDSERRDLAACRQVQMGEVARARQCLTGAALAPAEGAARPETVQRAIPRQVLEWEPETPVQIDRKMFMNFFFSFDPLRPMSVQQTVKTQQRIHQRASQGRLDNMQEKLGQTVWRHWRRRDHALTPRTVPRNKSTLETPTSVH